jgi:DNA-binding transcriptional MerR regulator
MIVRRTNLDDLAARTGLPVDTLRQLADLGLIGAWPDPTEAELVELRRVRRLIEDLGLEHEAVAVVLRMRRRLLELQHEVARLRAALRGHGRSDRVTAWVDAEWFEAYDKERQQ